MRREIDAREFRLDQRTEEGDGDSPQRLGGYAAVFDKEADIGGLFTEVIREGAFKRALEEEQEVFALVNHNPDRILGNSRSGTLELKEDKTGLSVDLTPPDTETGREILELVRRGDVSKMSFGFIPVEERWTERKGEPPLREIIDADVFDVSIVAFPAYDETSIAVRNADTILQRYLESREGHSPEPQPEPESRGLGSLLARFRLELLKAKRKSQEGTNGPK